MQLVSVSSEYAQLAELVFSSTMAMKAWFATVALALGLVQVSTGARIFGKLERLVPIQRPHVNRVHRWSGRLAVLFTLPVALHCVFIIGFQTTNARVLAHSLAGTFVYGVLAVKLFFVHDPKHPRWTLPLVGGTLFTVLVTLWATSSYWYFTEVRFGL